VEFVWVKGETHGFSRTAGPPIVSSGSDDRGLVRPVPLAVKGVPAWIKIIREDEAEGELKKMYQRLTEPWGGVDNILKIHSLNPPSLPATSSCTARSCVAARSHARSA
jgi:hypothetical protein